MLVGATEDDSVRIADPAHPGEVLRDDLAALGWTQCEAARNLGCARQSLGAVLNGKVRLSAKLALALEAGGIGKAHIAHVDGHAIRLRFGASEGGGVNGDRIG